MKKENSKLFSDGIIPYLKDLIESKKTFGPNKPTKVAR